MGIDNRTSSGPRILLRRRDGSTGDLSDGVVGNIRFSGMDSESLFWEDVEPTCLDETEVG